MKFGLWVYGITNATFGHTGKGIRASRRFGEVTPRFIGPVRAIAQLTSCGRFLLFRLVGAMGTTFFGTIYTLFFSGTK